MKKKRILIIAMGNSIHTIRWVSLLNGMNCEVSVFSSFTIPSVNYAMSYPEQVKLYHFERPRSKAMRYVIQHPIRVSRLIKSRGVRATLDSIQADIRVNGAEELAELLRNVDFDIIHTLHTQTSAVLLRDALALAGIKPKAWINSVWGSDLYLHQWLRGGKTQLQELLPMMDYYWGEGRRDYALARELGFRGRFLPPVPAFGGFDRAAIDECPYILPSRRKKILVKGYQNVVGRATVAFHALELCADLLRSAPYEVVLFSFENEIITTVAEVFSNRTGTKVQCVQGLPYHEILRLHGESRIYLGLSTSDGLPSSFIEAMACGAFPVQSDTSMGSEWATHGESAFFVPAEDAEEVASYIRVALTDDALVDSAGERNRQTVRERLDMRDVSCRVKDVYQNILDHEPIGEACEPGAERSGGGDADAANEDSGAPLVSVITVAYHHEAYIAQQIEGVVRQVTSFPYEFLIGDDGSDDATPRIIAAYAEKYPHIIRAVIRDKNVGVMHNIDDLLRRSRGKYIAVCDGDDYWTDPSKLQKQVDFLERNQDYTVCCHPVMQVYDDHSQADSILHPLALQGIDASERTYLTIHDLIRMNSVASLSVMYRWKLPRGLPEWMHQYIVADYPILLMHADKGRVGVLPEVMGVYRKHASGSWWNHNSQEQMADFSRLLLSVDKQLNEKYHDEFMEIVNCIASEAAPDAQTDSASDAPPAAQADGTGGAPPPAREASAPRDLKSRLKRCISKLPPRLQEFLYSVYHLKDVNRILTRLQTAEGQNAQLRELAELQANRLSVMQEQQRVQNELLLALELDLDEQTRALHEQQSMLTERHSALQAQHAELQSEQASLRATQQTQHAELQSEQAALRAAQQTQHAELQSEQAAIRAAQQAQQSALADRQRISDQRFALTSDAVRFLQLAQLDGIPTSFLDRLQYLIATSAFNDFEENYDAELVDIEACKSFLASVRQDLTKTAAACLDLIGKERIPHFETSYALLSDMPSKDIYIRLIVWRVLGFPKVKLLSDREVREGEWFDAIAPTLIDPSMPPISEAMFTLSCFRLDHIGYPIRCYSEKSALVAGLVRQQYAYQHITVAPGDVVLDCGACWGDTALWLASLSGDGGQVFSFEFVPSNIEVFRKNMSLNEQLARRIELVAMPVAEESGKRITFSDSGTSSKIDSPCDDAALRVPDAREAVTVSIDDFVRTRKLDRVDFIKMDIEGAEVSAIKGAQETIQRFHPKLAISAYHRENDLWEIPLLLHELCPEYKLYMKHCTRESWETVLFAIYEP